MRVFSPCGFHADLVGLDKKKGTVDALRREQRTGKPKVASCHGVIKFLVNLKDAVLVS